MFMANAMGNIMPIMANFELSFGSKYPQYADIISMIPANHVSSMHVFFIADKKRPPILSIILIVFYCLLEKDDASRLPKVKCSPIF